MAKGGTYKHLTLMYKLPSDTEWKVLAEHFSTKADALEYATDFNKNGKYLTKVVPQSYASHGTRWNRED